MRLRRAARRLTRDPDAPAVFLSPHLDDAVLSAWAVLTAPGELAVVTVCAGDPPPGEPAKWDRLTGAGDPVARMGDRREEDRRGLAAAGREPVHLAFPDLEYRPRRPLRPAEVLDALAEAVPAASLVYAPTGIGGHPDHLQVREAALALAAEGVPTTFYAELPYAVRYGWPAWVTGAEREEHLDPDVYWGAWVGALGAGREADVRTLDEAAATAKLAAVQAYATQFPALNAGHLDWLRNPLTLRHEVVWRTGS